MQHFFADPSCVDGEQIRLAGSDVNHMKNVLRMKPGEEVWVSDGEGMDYFCKGESEHQLKFLEPRVDFFKKHPSQLAGSEEN